MESLHDNMEGEESISSQQDEAKIIAMYHLDDTLIFDENLEFKGHVEDETPPWYKTTCGIDD